MDEVQSVFIGGLSDPLFPVVRAFVFAAGMPVLVVVGVELVAVVVVVGLSRHEFLPPWDCDGEFWSAGALCHDTLDASNVGTFRNLSIVLPGYRLLDARHVVVAKDSFGRGTRCPRLGAPGFGHKTLLKVEWVAKCRHMVKVQGRPPLVHPETFTLECGGRLAIAE